MRGNSHVRFLGGGGAAMRRRYPTFPLTAAAIRTTAAWPRHRARRWPEIAIPFIGALPGQVKNSFEKDGFRLFLLAASFIRRIHKMSQSCSLPMIYIP